ncbi:unnamed protein product [Zymoseptoria tritici ST99CH_3D7]|uniref:Uncharacterized protein n=1 Tax=Zymoseptoria tritici (strain ST99CH_3D7) TaxID=1276538 RepID=A0A1X7S363_ZYMT9|nr:unnamed protein product [Zymoseptoria tritici ST99CH_3D7]
MASDLSAQKLDAGLKRIDEIEQELAAELTTAEEEVSAARDALAQATAKLSQVRENHQAITERRSSITEFRTLPRYLRRDQSQTEELLRPIAGYELESADDSPPPPKAPSPSPAPVSKKRKAKRDPAPAAAAAAPASKRSKRAPEYLPACPTIVKTDEGTWVELRCSVCNGNTEPQKGQFYKGPAGLQKHLQTNHQQKVTRADVIVRCMHRAVSDGEVEKIESGEVEVERVVGVGQGKATSGRKGKAAGGGGKSRVAVPEEEEEAEGMEAEAEVEGGAVAEREEEEEEEEFVRPSDSVPDTEEKRLRLELFRQLQAPSFTPRD